MAIWKKITVREYSEEERNKTEEKKECDNWWNNVCVTF